MELPAILGGKPVREDKIFYGRQWISEKDIEAVRKVLAENDSASGDTEMLLKLALKEMF